MPAGRLENVCLPSTLVLPLLKTGPLQLPVRRLISQPLRSGSPGSWTPLPFWSLYLWAMTAAGCQLPKLSTCILPVARNGAWQSLLPAGWVRVQPLCGTSQTRYQLLAVSPTNEYSPLASVSALFCSVVFVHGWPSLQP